MRDRKLWLRITGRWRDSLCSSTEMSELYNVVILIAVLCPSMEIPSPPHFFLFSITGNFPLQPCEPELPTCTTNSRLIHCAEDKPTHLSSGSTAHAAAHRYCKTIIGTQKHPHYPCSLMHFMWKFQRRLEDSRTLTLYNGLRL